ncbi:AAA family ATPase [Kitasatospora sp. NPDC059088]|uniref:caspase, EACC1-associated type n=1 Tax=Kitasatospora sp. NPDC059088 TaxID=3346722 RepID=UPI0036A213F7
MPDKAVSGGGLPLGLPGARALVIGTGTHVPGSVLPDVPAAAATVHAVARALVEHCGLAPEHVRTVLDPEDPVVLGEALTAAAESADSVLLVYYVGHGLVDDDNELYLATRVTEHLTRGLAYKGLRYATLRRTLAGSRARSVVLVLDCCFSGRAAPVGRAGRAFEAAHPGGGFVLASAAPEELALAPLGAAYTAFSGELLRLLCEGDPVGPPQLTLDDVHRALSRTLRDRGFPAPRRQAEGRAGELVLAPNPAYDPPVGPHPPEPHPGACPYRGLAAYGAEDAPYFFGREELTERLVSRVATRLAGGGPLMVVGPSGAGKSSLLRAGLLPALDHGLPGALQAWRWARVVLTPGERPVTRLAHALAELAELAELADPGEPGEPDGPRHRGPEAIRAELMAAPESVLARLPADGTRPVLVVDQFEELFTACTDEREREVFVAALSAACTRGPEPDAFPRAVVLLGLRADFYGHCAAYPALAEALQDGQVLVGPMRTGELRDAVEKPALLAGLSLEPGLVDLLLRDLRTGGDRPRGPGAALPLLSYALLATWQKRAGRVLTMAGYQASGGIWGAVAQTAQATYDALDADGRRAARQLLLRMVHVVDGAEDTRRRVPLAELGLDADPAAQAALRALVGARLVVADDGHAELAHEAVLRAWQQLRDWIEHDRAGLQLRQRLHDAADAWERDGRDEGALYRGVRLAAAVQWVEESAQRHGTTPVAREFVAAGQARQAAERRAERRRTTRLRALSGVLAVLLTVAVAGVGTAAWQNRIAHEQRDLLASKVGAQAAGRIRTTDPTLALQLALSARHIADTPEARGSLFDSALAPYSTPVAEPTGTVRNLAHSAERHLLASTGSDRSVRLWDLSDPRDTKPLSTTRTGTGHAGLALSPDGRLLAAEDTDTSVRLWNVTDPTRPEALALLPDSSGALALSPDGHRLAVLGQTGSSLWDLTDPRHPVRSAALPTATGTPQSGAFSSDGRLLALLHGESEDSTTVQLWNVADPSKPALTGSIADSHGLGLAFSPRAPLLALGRNGRGVGLWDTTDPAKPAPVNQASYDTSAPVAIDSQQTVAALAFAPDGRTLAFGSSRSDEYFTGHAETVDLRDPHSPVGVVDYPTSETVYAVALDDRGSSLLSAGTTLRRWHPAPATVLSDTGAYGNFTQDGRTLAWAFDPPPGRSTDGARQYRLWRTDGPYDTRQAGTLTGLNGGTVRAVDDHTLLTYSDVAAPLLWDVSDPDHPRRGGTLNALSEPLDHTGVLSDFMTDLDARNGLVVANGRDGRIHVWDASDASAPKELSTFSSPQPPGQLHLVNRKLVSLDRMNSHRISVWDLGDPAHPTAAPPIDLDTNVAQADEAQNRLAIALAKIPGSNPKTIQLWDLADPRHPEHGALPEAPVTDFAFSHDGRTLAVSNDSTVDLWDVSDVHRPQRAGSLVAQKQFNLEFSPDNRLLISRALAERDTLLNGGQIHLWEVADPHAPTEIAVQAPKHYVPALGFSPDGRSLLISQAAGDNDPSRVTILDPDIDRLTRHLCDVAGATITEAQWKQYFPGTPYDRPCG